MGAQASTPAEALLARKPNHKKWKESDLASVTEDDAANLPEGSYKLVWTCFREECLGESFYPGKIYGGKLCPPCKKTCAWHHVDKKVVPYNYKLRKSKLSKK
jgi:hypothetical protein